MIFVESSHLTSLVFYLILFTGQKPLFLFTFPLKVYAMKQQLAGLPGAPSSNKDPQTIPATEEALSRRLTDLVMVVAILAGQGQSMGIPIPKKTKARAAYYKGLQNDLIRDFGTHGLDHEVLAKLIAKQKQVDGAGKVRNFFRRCLELKDEMEARPVS